MSLSVSAPFLISPNSRHALHVNSPTFNPRNTALALLGDLHGEATALTRLDRELAPGVPIVQVGDFGWYPTLVTQWNSVGASLQRSVYWIRGNHEHYPSMPWLNAADPVLVAPNIHFVPDGCVLDLGGVRLGCLGGAASIDYRFRRLGVDWFDEENITPVQVGRTASWRDLDLVVTHVPPQHVITASANPLTKHQFGVPAHWRDSNADVVETIWRQLNCPPLVCGHMHYSYQSADGVRILDINEPLCWPDDP